MNILGLDFFLKPQYCVGNLTTTTIDEKAATCDPFVVIKTIHFDASFDGIIVTVEFGHINKYTPKLKCPVLVMLKKFNQDKSCQHFFSPSMLNAIRNIFI